MRVTAKYGITGPVPFVDVHVERDNRLFLDPSAIRNGRDARSIRAHKLLLSFFHEVLRLRRSHDPADHAMGIELLKHLHEPNQTRLGMSAKKIGGKALGDGLADDLWDVLGSDAAAQAAVLANLEHLPLFIHGVGPDLISDLTTRIIFEELLKFTEEMMARYPAIAGSTSDEEIDLYNPSAKLWADRIVRLPFIAPHQLLLVPKQWVYWRLLMEPDPFYNRFSTETVKIERGIYDEKGKFHGPLKKSLKKEFPDQRKLNTVQAVKYKREQNRDLVAEYQEYVDRIFEVLSDAEIASRTA